MNPSNPQLFGAAHNLSAPELESYPLRIQFERNPEPFSRSCMEELTDTMMNEALLYSDEVEWFNSTTIDLEMVIGTQHPDYANSSWLALLQNGKRMSHNLGLHRFNPGYYDAHETKMPTMFYIQIGEKIYIGGDGNHRTCIAKHHFSNQGQIHGVNLMKYKINDDLVELRDAWNRLIDEHELWHLSPEIVRTKLRREDKEGWMREDFALEFVLQNRKISESLNGSVEVLMALMEHFRTRKTLLGRLFGSKKTYEKYL